MMVNAYAYKSSIMQQLYPLTDEASVSQDQENSPEMVGTTRTVAVAAARHHTAAK
jgi:hypothetical protein